MSNWIKWMKGLGRRREVLSVARALSISRKESAATFAEIWSWADDETRNGKLHGITLREIDAIAEIEGFAQAMIDVGWLKQVDGGLELTRWKRHNGENAKKRAQAAERMARKRERESKKELRAPRNEPRTKRVTREEKRREEYIPTVLPPSEVCSEPPSGDSEPASDERDSETIMVFPCVGRGPTEWPLTDAKVAEYRQSYPAVDVLGECRKARQWCIDNPEKRKTFRGLPAFLNRWLGRCQDAGDSHGKTRRNPASTGGVTRIRDGGDAYADLV